MGVTHIKRFAEIDFSNRESADPAKWIEDPPGTFTAQAGAAVFIERTTGNSQSHSGAGCPAGSKVVVNETAGVVKFVRP